LPSHGKLAASPTEKQKERDGDPPIDVRSINMAMSVLAVTHKLQDAAVPLRIFFSVCLIALFFAGIYVFRKRHQLFDRDPDVSTDLWAARNLRLWQVLLVWLLAMELLITMLFRI
jgi:hypothetical protein